MVNLYTLPSWEILLFIVVSMVLFLVNSVLYYFLMPQAEFSHLGRKCLEADHQRWGGNSELRIQQAAGLPQVSISPLPNGNGDFFNRSAP